MHQINTCLFDDIPAPINSPYITFDTEVRLLNTAKTGAVSETELLLDEIREENFQEHNLSANAGKILIYDLIAVILRIRHQVIGLNGIDEWIGQITHEAEHTNFYSAFEKLRAAFIEITRQIETRKEKRKESLISRVKNYIDINYSDCNICLYQVSEEFSVSEYHLSRLFKKTTGIAFHDYVEDVRLSKAAQCIQGSNDRIKEIAESVGYTSMTTFGRAFKRKFRVSPTDYRKNALGPGEG
jgi:two-component system response regulator YesN